MQREETFPAPFSCDRSFPSCPDSLTRAHPQRVINDMCPGMQVDASHGPKPCMHYSLLFCLFFACGVKILLEMSERPADVPVENSDKKKRKHLCFIYSTEGQAAGETGQQCVKHLAEQYVLEQPLYVGSLKMFMDYEKTMWILISVGPFPPYFLKFPCK